MKGRTYPHINSANYYYINTYIIRIIIKACLLIVLCAFSISVYSQNHPEIQLANEYVLKGDRKKAIELYRDLVKNDANIPIVHNNYLNVLLDAGAYEEA